MPGPTATITATVTQAGSSYFDANWASVALTFVLICVTIYYALEARWSRETAQDALNELKRQHAQEFEDHEKDRSLTMQYVQETQKAREISEQELDLLKQQHLDQYDAFVVPSYINSNIGSEGEMILRLINLGPGPAKHIEVRAAVFDGRSWRWWQAERSGLAVGSEGDWILRESRPFTQWHENIVGKVNVELRVTPTLGEDRIERMPLPFGYAGPL